ncbi:MAG: protein kinase [Acidobacteriota bacterium]
MAKCRECLADIAAENHACPSCGARVDSSILATLIKAPDKESPRNPFDSKISDSFRSADSIDGARFIPGTLIVDRYRIRGLLGKGGMGEVYRADDLKLGQPVALKFLPENLANDAAVLVRFHKEVSIARQVSHPNVCRVFDIGDANGFHFLSMEYVDGEDMDSLLRRIGRLPADKATEISRQICAGLAAAHDAGVLHRDLKPANIMVDGRGKARITDFGLAVIAEQLRSDEGIAGTPAYMSPEQLTGKEITTKSDIYALGLVLFELYTGKRAFRAESLADYIKLHQESVPTTPSSLVPDLDPLVERVILRCLEKDPAKRPASAIHVAAALPGGDPLQAALAAGETPSPAMVAAAGKNSGVRPAIAVTLLASTLVVLLLTILLGSRLNILDLISAENTPDMLQHRAREITSQLGYADRPVDFGYGMHFDRRYLQYLDENVPTSERWDRIAQQRPVPVHFWYRESPDYLQSNRINLRSGVVTEDDPPLDQAGMTGLELDSQGNLRSFYAVAPEAEGSGVTVVETDWTKVLGLAGLDTAALSSAESEWIPRHAYDKRVAWIGTYPNQPEPPIRVEAASRNGKVVSFNVYEPWMQPAGAPLTTGQKANSIFGMSLFCLVVIGAALLARRNLRKGKGDRRGAIRFAVFVATLLLTGWMFGADHVPTSGEATIFSQAIASSLFYGGVVWLLYIALEPLVRRRWPTAIISWSRVLDGGIHDPLVARDLLIGILAGICMSLLDYLLQFANGDISPSSANLQSILGIRQFLGWFLEGAGIFVLFPLLMFFIIFLLRALLRREWLVALLFILLALTPSLLFGLPKSQIVANIFFFLGVFILAVRYGLFSFVVAFWISQITAQPFTTNFTAWYAVPSIAVILIIVGLAVYAFRTSLAGQSLFRGGSLLED